MRSGKLKPLFQALSISSALATLSNPFERPSFIARVWIRGTMYRGSTRQPLEPLRQVQAARHNFAVRSEGVGSGGHSTRGTRNAELSQCD